MTTERTGKSLFIALLMVTGAIIVVPWAVFAVNGVVGVQQAVVSAAVILMVAAVAFCIVWLVRRRLVRGDELTKRTKDMYLTWAIIVVVYIGVIIHYFRFHHLH
ncbi:MAG TPA: hypothetical protein VF271_07490 [Rhodanobacteraceae bacterium]